MYPPGTAPPHPACLTFYGRCFYPDLEQHSASLLLSCRAVTGTLGRTYGCPHTAVPGAGRSRSSLFGVWHPVQYRLVSLVQALNKLNG